jgi:hypothetical protein
MIETGEDEIQRIKRQLEGLSNPFGVKSEVKEQIDMGDLLVEGDETKNLMMKKLKRM